MNRWWSWLLAVLSTTAPMGCRLCGVEIRSHGQRWHPCVGFHMWQAPDRELIEARLRTRFATREILEKRVKTQEVQ